MMNACRKCDNTNVVWNGGWRQCVNCGEVHERESYSEHSDTFPSQAYMSLDDITSLPLKSTLMGKLIARFHLIR
jgi:transcription initiation factor TFIIIB Brf1 subunit/transcription initiation factor TFIIB